MKRPQLLLSSCLALALVAAISTSRTASAAGLFVTDTIAPNTDLILPFGEIALGGRSPVHTVTLANPDPSNEVAVPLLQLSSPAFILDPNGGERPCGLVTMLSPQTFCTFTVTFKPNSIGSHSALLALPLNLGEERIVFHDISTDGISLFGLTSSHVTIVTDPPGGVKDLNPSWSPGQGQIVFHRQNTNDDTDTILRINVDPFPDGTREITLVANNGTTPAWSPDGQRIAYHAVPNGGILQVDLNRNKLDEAGNVGAGGARFDPKWSPDGKKLAFRLAGDIPDGSSPNDIFIMNKDGSSEVLIADGGKTPSWSPDRTGGQKIAFQKLSTGDISIVDPTQNQTPKTITTPPFGSVDKNPSWSPDGTKIVFHRQTILPPGDVLRINNLTGPDADIKPPGKTPDWSPSDQVSISFVGTGLALNDNSPPTAPQLISPTINQKDVKVPVIFKWLSSTDPDGDTLTYDLLVCPSAVFPFGACVLEENVGLQSAQKPMTSAGVWLSGGSLLFGIAFSGRRRLGRPTTRRSIWNGFFILTIMVISLNACGGGGGGGNIPSGGGGATATGVELSHTLEDLEAGTSFTWQVTAKDETNSTPSVARSFTTAPLAP